MSLGQEVVFQCLGESLLRNAFQGYNACIFAYGQTGNLQLYGLIHDMTGFAHNMIWTVSPCPHLDNALKLFRLWLRKECQCGCVVAGRFDSLSSLQQEQNTLKYSWLHSVAKSDDWKYFYHAYNVASFLQCHRCVSNILPLSCQNGINKINIMQSSTKPPLTMTPVINTE